jgi:O-antigen ligase
LYQDGNWTKKIILAYSSGALILIIPTILDGTGTLKLLSLDLSNIKDDSYTNLSLVYWRNHIINGFHTSILFTICILTALSYRKYYLILSFIALLCLLDVVFFINGRLALASIIVASASIIVMKVKVNNYKYIATFIVTILIFSFFNQSSNINNRIKSVATEARLFYDDKNINTSGGTRLFYWSMSLKLFMNNPIFGAGPGSFRHKLLSPDNPLQSAPHKHAHNEYLSLLSQNGLIGITIFICLVFSIFKKNNSSGNHLVKDVIKVGLILFLLNAITDSSLNNESEGWTFVLFAAISNFLTRINHENDN